MFYSYMVFPVFYLKNINMNDNPKGKCTPKQKTYKVQTPYKNAKIGESFNSSKDMIKMVLNQFYPPISNMFSSVANVNLSHFGFSSTL